MKTICKFTFPEATDAEMVEAQIAHAIFTAECVYGQSKVRLDGGFYVPDSESATYLIDITTPVGETIARVFTGLVTRELGEDGFRVERILGQLAERSVS